MTNITQIIQQIEALEPPYRQEVADFVDFVVLRRERERDQFLAALAKSEADVAAGRVYEDADVWARMEEKFGPLGDADE